MNQSKTHWKKQFNYNYAGSYNLLPGQELILTIAKIVKEMVKGENGQEKECVVCYFRQDFKPMILNKTNCKIIQKVYGTPFIEEWIGKNIQIYTDTVMAFGDIVEALRIRDFVPKILTDEDKKKKELKKEIRTTLKNYTGEDKDEIRNMLTDKQKAKEDTILFLENTLNTLLTIAE